MSSNKREPAAHQARRPRKKRTRQDQEKRDAAFAPKKRGRPTGSKLAFFDDPDRFAVAIIYCGESFLNLPRYSAAYVAVGLTSDGAIDAGSIDKALRLSGGPQHATLKGASYSLVAKCDRHMAIAEADWVASSAALLWSLINLHTDRRRPTDPIMLRTVFDGLAARGWAPMLLKIAKKLSAVGASNLPPIDEPVSFRVQTWLDSRSSKQKS